MNRRLGSRRDARSPGNSYFGPELLSPYLWFEADSGITQVGNRISAWASKVNGVSLAQGAGANQPLYVASDAGYNNKPIVNVDDVARVMSATVSRGYPFSTFEFGEPSASGSYGYGLDGGPGTCAWNRSGTDMRVYGYDGVGTAFTPSIVDAAAKRSLYRGAAVSQAATISRNGGQSTATATNSRLATGVTHTTLYIGWPASLSIVGKLAAFFVFTRELTAPEVYKMHRWCVAKYGSVA